MISDIFYINDFSSCKNISKRDFLKSCLYGVASVASYGLLNSIPTEAKSSELWKWSKEAFYYSKQKDAVYCELCPNDCIIRPDKKGDCRTRINQNGKLYTIVYGNPCAVHVDPIEKKPLFHFLPTAKAFSIATAGCNMKCLNCQNWEISQADPENTNNYDLMPFKVVETCIQYKCEAIAYTYSEPIIFYEYVYDTAKIARGKGIKNILVSAGFIYEKPLRELCKYIDAANIDLKNFDDNIHKKLNGVPLKPVLTALNIFKEEGVWLEITNLIIPNWTDDMNMIKKMCQWLVKNNLHEFPLHFSRFQPLYKLAHLAPTPVSTLEKAREIALDVGIKYVYLGNVPGIEGENTYCPKCKKMLIERKGYFIAKNDIVDSKCKHCKEKIAGVWRN